MRQLLLDEVRRSVKTAYPDVADDLIGQLTLDPPRDSSHGDFSSNVAFLLKDVLRDNPRHIAETLVEKLASERHRIRKSADQLSEPPPSEEPAPADPLEGAVGVTPMTLVHDAVCGLTGEKLPAGSEAYMVLFDDPRRKLITGRNALPQASTPNEEQIDD